MAIEAAHAYLIDSEEFHLLALITPGGFLNTINKINVPARTMEILSDMETYATVDMTATMAVFLKYGICMLRRLRLHSRCRSTEAEEEAGGLPGRLYLDSIAQALASALVQLRGNLKKLLPHYHCGLKSCGFQSSQHFARVFDRCVR